MVPLHLALRNFMCYRAADDGEPLRLNLDGLHVLCLSGDNGAGKSTILDAITWALWGEARSADDDLIAQGETEMMVELVFALDGRTYRVIRQRQRGRSSKRGVSSGKTWLDLQIRDGATWRPIGENTIRETQAKINDLLRMSYRTFINASFLLQGRADEFTSKTPAERKEVLAEILNLAEYAELERRARERARQLEASVINVRGRLDSLRPIADQLPVWQQAVADAERRQIHLRTEREALETEYTRAYQRLQALEELARRQRDIQHRLTALASEIERHERDLRELDQRIARDEQMIARRPAIEAGLRELTAARAELDRLEEQRNRYDALIERKRELQQELKAELSRLNEQLLRAERRRDLLLAEAQRQTELQARARQLQQRLRALAPINSELQRAYEQRAMIEQRLHRIRDLEHRYALAQEQLNQRRAALNQELTRHRQDLRRIEEHLAEAARWQHDLVAAQAAQRAVHELEQQQAERRQQEQATVDAIGAARAALEQARTQAAKLRANQALLAADGGECPVCRHQLDPREASHVLAHYEQELAQLEAAAAQAQAALQSAEQRLTTIRAALTADERELTRLRRQAANVEPLSRQLAQAEAWAAQRDALIEQIASIDQRLATDDIAPDTRAELEMVRDELAALGDRDGLQHDLRMIHDEISERERQLREQSRLEGELDVCQRDLARIETVLVDLPAAEAEVAELQSQIAENDFGHAIRVAGRQVVAEIEALNYQPDMLEATRATVRALTHWEAEERELLLAEQRYASDSRLREQARALREHACREQQTLRQEAETLARDLIELPAAQLTVNQLAQRLSEISRAMQVAERDLAEKQAYLKQAEAAASEVQALTAQEQQLTERAGLFAELAEAFGKKGAQAMLIETAIPQLEDEANQLLGRLTGGQMHLRFEMQRDTKKGDTVETLDVQIGDALGTRNYDAFSGGEAMRVNFAIRIALSRLLAHRAGARLETLVIDEGFGSLDADGRERMVEAITAIQNDFARIIVITHIDDLKDRFPAALEIRKTPQGSRWELRN